ncbi:GPI transamidase-like protein component PIG-U [Endogone sp. FLAS-F59071]|nr:GPI transamidase-like protein component PIG-U [Endogone sp. FLAS-F59071]|eukprot:RUS14551.1 GPI transamidase-like protein component PIG-U [Endogone sp. FLAS-F59071]
MMTEGLYLFQSHVPPYDGGVFHQSPILLALFQLLNFLPPLAVPVMYALTDLTIAWLLTDITAKKQAIYESKPKLAVENGQKGIAPWTVGALYLFNPLSILSCVSKSTIIFTNASVVFAVYYALKGDKSLGMFWVAMASYLSFYPAMLIIPVTLIIANWSANEKATSKKVIVLSCVLLYTTWLAALLYLSYMLVGSWNFLPATYGVIVFLSDLTPNVGLFWYFFIEMFDQFRAFFLVVFQLHAFIFAAPLSIKLIEHPIFVIFILCGIMGIFKSYPSIGDAALYLGFLPIHDELFKYTRYGFLTTNLFLYASALGPIFWHLWIYAGSGNANFFYAITLVYNIGQILLLIDTMYAMLRRSFDAAHPEALGKEIVHK